MIRLFFSIFLVAFLSISCHAQTVNDSLKDSISQINSCWAQEHVKKDLYIFFDASKSGAHKIRRGADSQRPYDIYTFKVIDVRNGKPRKIVLNSVDLNRSKFKNEVFAQQNGRFISDLELIKAFDYDTFNDVKFPFKKVYILELQTSNVYKLTNVVTYIGSDFN